MSSLDQDDVTDGEPTLDLLTLGLERKDIISVRRIYR
jgi:hypothetical protein